MPSEVHEVLVEVFRSRPEVVLDLARRLGLVPLPDGVTARAVGEGISERVTDYRPDCVLELRDAAGHVARTLVVEVQLGRDDGKRYALPVYVALLHARHRRPCDVIVVTPSADVASWMRAPIDVGASSWVAAFVVGPEELGRVGGAEDAAPELWFLRALATVERHPRVVLEAERALAGVPEPTAALYLDHLLTKIPEAVRAAIGRELERGMVDLSNYEFKSDFFRERFARATAKAEAAGHEAGRQAGHEAGRQAGREEGGVQALRNAVLTVLDERGLAANDDQRATILSTDDADLLATWLRRAVSAAAVEDVLAP